MKFTTEHIVQYLAGSLSKEATQLFEQELLTNSELQAELEIQKLTNSLIGINEENKILSSIKTAQSNYQRKNIYKKAGIAILLLIGGASALWFFNQEVKELEVDITSIKKEASPQSNHERSVEKTIVKDTISSKTTIDSKQKVANGLVSEKQSSVKTKKIDIIEPKNDKEKIIQGIKQAIVIENTPITTTTQKTYADHPNLVSPNPCDIISIETNLAIEHVCPQLSLGAIDILNTTGGLSPYTYDLKMNNISIKDWSELKTGTYIFITKDAANCTSEKTITIVDKDCPLNYDFNPSLGQQWKTLKALENGKITITHAKSGEQIFKTNLISGETIAWDGLKNNGDYSLGFHIFVIEYENNKIVKGKITVSQ